MANTEDNNKDKNPRDDDFFAELFSRLLDGNLNKYKSWQPLSFNSTEFLGNLFAIQSPLFKNSNNNSKNKEVNINWNTAHEYAIKIASLEDRNFLKDSNKKRNFNELVKIADIWINKNTIFPVIELPCKLWTRKNWINNTLGFWQNLTKEISNKLSTNLANVLNNQIPLEIKSNLRDTNSMFYTLGNALFSAQLGQTVGSLANEVLSMTDVGISESSNKEIILLPSNINKISTNLSLSKDDTSLYIIIREIASKRLHTQSKWLYGYLLGLIRNYANEINIDISNIEEIVKGTGLKNNYSIQDILYTNLISPKNNKRQTEALHLLEHVLVLIESWIDNLVNQSIIQMKSHQSLIEAFKRRQITSSPLKQTFFMLTGTHINSIKFQKYLSFWKLITKVYGQEKRDSIWKHPDFMPSIDNINKPKEFFSEKLKDNNKDKITDKMIDDLIQNENDQKK